MIETFLKQLQKRMWQIHSVGGTKSKVSWKFNRLKWMFEEVENHLEDTL